MKSFLIAASIFSIAACVLADLSDEQKQKVVAFGKECIAETGVDKALVEKARQGSFSDDPKLKAFAFCLSKKIGLQNASGDVQVDVLKQKLSSVVSSPDAANSLISACVQSKGSPEETAFHTFVCYYEKTPTHVSIF
ncbi:B2 protein-like [Rhynchophorus ferrugineus]|uniref:B2 protein-like n=1 Tax=Rhynchophorus ferrugineus TaxID=354439 RepID=UPI003FCD1777